MKYRPLGKTGVQISELVFGAGAVGGILINPDDETKLAAVSKALAGGVNWIDTAASYGNGKSEESLGWLLKEPLPTGPSGERQPFLSTKFRVEPGAGDISGQIERSMHESLSRLKRGSVDLFQLHNPVVVKRGEHSAFTSARAVSLDDVLAQSGVIEGLRRLQGQNLTRYIGFTGVGETAALHQLVESREFDTAQVYYNLLNPSAGRPMMRGSCAHDYSNLIGKCAQHGVGVLNIRVLAAGVIAGESRTGREGSVSPGSDAESDAQRAALARVAVGHGQGTMAQAAVRYALPNPDVAGVLVGFSTLGHIDEAIGAVEMGPLGTDVLSRLGKLHDTDFGRIPDHA